MSNIVLSTENLTKRFGEITAVKDLSIEIEQGQVYGFLGPNGSGKTTTISLILGLLTATSGKVNLFGEDWKSGSLRRMGVVMDLHGFYPNYSGLDNLLLFGEMLHPVDRNRIAEVLKLVGLADRAQSKFRTYSMGMKQRLAVALALLDDPEFLILDEPTNGMDPEGIVEIRNLIIELNRQGKTILLASHLLSEVEQVCTHLAIMKKGVVVKQGALADLLDDNAATDTVFEIVTGNLPATTVLLQSLGYPVKQGRDRVLVSASGDAAEKISATLAGEKLFVTEMRRTTGSLESVFIEATQQSKKNSG
ncbi:MAG: ABC transporter ATP-binding protein [Dehalogenimonas sp.]